MNEGEHFLCVTSPSLVDQVGFEIRRRGFEVRDVLRIQRSDQTWIGFLVRREMSETVLHSFVRHQTGSMDIDAARISLVNSSGVQGGGHEGGRFPTNFLLIHEPECEVVGTKKVRSGVTGTSAGGFGNTNIVYGEGAVNETHGYAGEDGLEETLEWDCQPSCPVRLLDQQSGILHSQDPETRKKGQNSTETHAVGFGTKTESAYGDEGGASRFFYQAESVDDIEKYLECLTGNEPFEVEDE